MKKSNKNIERLMNLDEAIEFFTELMISDNPQALVSRSPNFIQQAMRSNEYRLIQSECSDTNAFAHKTTIFKLH